LELLGEVGGVDAAGLGADVDQRLAGVVLAAEEGADLHLVEGLLHLGELGLGLGAGVRVVLLLGHLEQHGEVVDPASQCLSLPDLGLEVGELAGDLLRLFRVVPEGRRGRLLLEHGDFCPHLVEVQNGLDRLHGRGEGLELFGYVDDCHTSSVTAPGTASSAHCARRPAPGHPLARPHPSPPPAPPSCTPTLPHPPRAPPRPPGPVPTPPPDEPECSRLGPRAPDPVPCPPTTRTGHLKGQRARRGAASPSRHPPSGAPGGRQGGARTRAPPDRAGRHTPPTARATPRATPRAAQAGEKAAGARGAPGRGGSHRAARGGDRAGQGVAGAEFLVSWGGGASSSEDAASQVPTPTAVRRATVHAARVRRRRRVAARLRAEPGRGAPAARGARAVPWAPPASSSGAGTRIDVWVSRLESEGRAPGTSGTAPLRTGPGDGTGSSGSP